MNLSAEGYIAAGNQYTFGNLAALLDHAGPQPWSDPE